MAVDVSFPIPVVLEEMQPFWDALKEKRFVLLRCSKCKAWYWPFAACRTCRNDEYFANMTWEPASGRGKVFSFTRPQWTFHPAIPAPFVYAEVELEEGPIMPSNVIGCKPEDVKVGMPLEVEFVEVTPGLILPKFRPRK
jgi:uncharacterized OB-fold protein